MNELSSIDLSDSGSIEIDDGPRSIAYFCQNRPVCVNTELVSQLKEISKKLNGVKNIRVCLHENPAAKFHDMIVLEHKDKYYRPHKHLKKGESFHIIEGQMGIFTFDDVGVIIDRCLLKLGGSLIYRVEANMYHAVLPLSNFVIYHEAKLGPFTGKEDSIYASWTPDGNNSKEVFQYVSSLRQSLENQ